MGGRLGNIGVGGIRGTRLADFGMVEYCQLVKRCFLTEGQDVGTIQKMKFWTWLAK